ncbi:MAG: Fis family transcriptional regulator [Gammaproteobacteria bacterium]|nr:Fis family transcriptional regulator [Gammaproteobacteria bacterium]|tara:strand:- start:1459 stop:1746 length:288 start_codon:yes stop_codon:yes gene_type:complete
MSADRIKTRDVVVKSKSLGTLERPLNECVRESVDAYFETLGEHEVTGLYQMVLREVEKPLLQAVLEQTAHNQSNAAQVLGMSRGTLRKKLKDHGL